MQKIAKFVLRCITVLILAAALYGCAPQRVITSQPEQNSASVESMKPQTATSLSPSPEDAKKKYRFAIVYGGPHAFFASWEAAAQQAAKDLNLPLPNVTCPPEWDQEEQNAIIDGLMENGLDGLGIFTADAVAGNDKITELAKKGIPVVTLGGPPAQPTKAKFCYATDTALYYQNAMQALIDELKRRGKNKGNIVLFSNVLSDTSTISKEKKSLRDVLEKPENAGFVLFKELSDMDVEENAQKAIDAVYASYIDQVDGILCIGYTSTQVLARNLNKRKSDDGMVVIGRFDAPETLEAIRNEYMFGTMVENSWAMGYVGIAALKLFAEGYTWKKDAPFDIDSGTFLLKKDGLSTCEQKQKQNAYDFAAMMQEKYFDPPAEAPKPPVEALPSSATEDVKKKYQFSLVYGGPHPFFKPWEAAAQAAAKDLNLPLPNVTCPQEWDQMEQNSIIDGLTEKGLNGLGIFTADAVAGNEKITELATMDIPVVALGNAPSLPTYAKFCYATDTALYHGAAMQAMIDELKRRGKTKGNIVLLYTGMLDTGINKDLAAIQEVLQKPENEGFVLYKMLPDTDTVDGAENAVSTMYASYIDQVDGILCNWYTNTQVLARTLNSRKPDDGIVIIGRDDAPETLEAIRGGYMFGTMAENSWAMGYVGVAALKLFADGYTWKKDAPFFIDSGTYLLKKNGLSNYEETQKQNAFKFMETMQEKYFDPPAAQ